MDFDDFIDSVATIAKAIFSIFRQEFFLDKIAKTLNKYYYY